MSSWYLFYQNNSGGAFEIDDEAGIGPRVWIEADSPAHANERAMEIGVYFDGVYKGVDCPCCGDRWRAVGTYDACDAIELHHDTDWHWHTTVYAHPKHGSVVRMHKLETVNA